MKCGDNLSGGIFERLSAKTIKLPLFPPPPPKIKKATVQRKGLAKQRALKALDKQQETADKRYKAQRKLEDFREQQQTAHEHRTVVKEHRVAVPEPAEAYRNRLFLRDQLATTITRR